MKPVTYLKKDDSTGLYYECDKEYGFPVYTHPVKELTDEEIQEVYSKQHEIPCNILGFARAILRKAQEK